MEKDRIEHPVLITRTELLCAGGFLLLGPTTPDSFSNALSTFGGKIPLFSYDPSGHQSI